MARDYELPRGSGSPRGAPPPAIPTRRAALRRLAAAAVGVASVPALVSAGDSGASRSAPSDDDGSRDDESTAMDEDHGRAIEAAVANVADEILRERLAEAIAVRSKSRAIGYLRRRLAAARRDHERCILVETLRVEDASHRFVLVARRPGAKTLSLASNRTSREFRDAHPELFAGGDRDRYVFEFELELESASDSAREPLEKLAALEKQLAGGKIASGAWGRTATLDGSTRVLMASDAPKSSPLLLYGYRFAVDSPRAKAPEGEAKPAYDAVATVYQVWALATDGKLEPQARYELAPR